MNFSNQDAYELLEEREIKDLDSVGYVLRHKKTGAKVCLLENSDDNKVFSISFRTPPENSTGVPHIVEHTVLCGSKEFPCKDPFIELAKGSLNTFLNAMTFPDKTMYPVASCNDKDFQNLMHVYLDAVFYPNIYKEEKIFRQEGWHYEMENADDPLEINGVVYSEMKGAFSSAEDVVERQIMNALFPDSPYGVESGGDPDVIPQLSYEEFLEFHSRYYHPSNSYLYLYGNMDFEEKLRFIDEHYFSKFDYQPIDSHIPLQKSFEEPKEIRIEYPISEEEDENDNTFLAYSTVMGENDDRLLYVAIQVLDYAICSAPGAPLKKALIEKGIGKDVYSCFENGIRQPFFTIYAKNASENQKEEFLSTIREVLQGIVTNHFDRKSLMSALTYFEFKYREADYGTYPKGLMYGMQVMDSWLYNDRLVFWHIEQNETFKELKKRVDTGYFEELVEKYLLKNPHCVKMVAVPKKGLTSQREAQLAEKLNAYKMSLSAKEIEKIVNETRALKEYQETPDDPKLLEAIPLLSREDISPDPRPYQNKEEQIGNTLFLKHDVFTNGIAYINILFDLKNIPLEDLKYIVLLKTCLGYMDTDKHSYGDFFHEMSLYTGGIAALVKAYRNVNRPKEFELKLMVKTKLLYENMEKGFELIEEMIFGTILSNEERFKEIIAESKSRLQSQFISSGHSVAAMRAMSYFSEEKMVYQELSGIEYYRLIDRIDKNFETEGKKAIEQMEKLRKMIFRPEHLILDYTSPEKEEWNIRSLFEKFTKRLYNCEIKKSKLEAKPEKKNEAFKTSASIQYVCMAGNFADKGLPYDSRLNVLKVILGYDYLWNTVRVKGGAYGCMTSFERFGDAYFVSYRDPNLSKTLDAYKGIVPFLEQFDADERTMTKFIIGTVSDMDVPLTPCMKGTRSLEAYLSGITEEELRKNRAAVLSTKPEDIRALARYVEAILSDDCICVVGGENAISENQDLFMNVTSLV